MMTFSFLFSPSLQLLIQNLLKKIVNQTNLYFSFYIPLTNELSESVYLTKRKKIKTSQEYISIYRINIMIIFRKKKRLCQFHIQPLSKL